MLQRNLLFFLFFGCLSFSRAQTSVAPPAFDSTVFVRIMDSIKSYQPDTTAPPDDKITWEIIRLRKLRGGFNINEVMSYKAEEDRRKKEKPADELDRSAAYFQSGNGRKWLENAVIWIYRRHFTYDELKTLTKFYSTSAGQKFAADLPVIMVQSMAAAQMLADNYSKQAK
jgi:uncharacterized protein